MNKSAARVSCAGDDFELVGDADPAEFEYVEDDCGSQRPSAGDVHIHQDVDEERRVDPEDGQNRTFQEVMARYRDMYPATETEAYWHNHCRRRRLSGPPWRRSCNATQQVFADARCLAGQSLLHTVLSLLQREDLSAAFSGVKARHEQVSKLVSRVIALEEEPVFAGLDPNVEGERVAAQMVDRHSVPGDRGGGIDLAILADVLVGRASRRLDELSSQIPMVVEPPEVPLCLVPAPCAACASWKQVPVAKAAVTEQSRTWDAAYTQAGLMRPIWLIERPREELRRLLDERWVDPACPGLSQAVLALEFGCGLGHDALHLAEKGFHVVGLDLSQTAIEGAQAEARHRLLNTHAHFLVADAYDLPTPDEPFALIYDNTLLGRAVCDPVTPHSASDYKAMLLRMTRPGSLVFLLVLSEEMADKTRELHEQRGIHLPRMSAVRLAALFLEDFAFVFLRKGVYDFDCAFEQAAAEVGWHEPTELGGHPSWCLLMRRRQS